MRAGYVYIMASVRRIRSAVTKVTVIPALSRDPPSLQRQRWKAEVLGKIAPGRVLAMDEIVFPRTRPALDPLLAEEGLLHRVVGFEPDQPLDAVSIGESGHDTFAMLPNSPRQVRRYACIQRAVRRSRQ